MGIITRFHRNEDRTYEFSAWYATDDEADLDTCPPGRPYIMRKGGLSDEQVDAMITRLTQNGQMSLFTGSYLKMEQALRNLNFSSSEQEGRPGPVIGELTRALTSLPPAVQKKLWSFYALESVPGASAPAPAPAAGAAADSAAAGSAAPSDGADASGEQPAGEGHDGTCPCQEHSRPDELIMPANSLYPFFYHYGMIDVVVAAAGVGARMKAGMPKQYMMLGQRTVLEHTVLRLLCWPLVRNVILVVSPEDEYIQGSLLNSLDRLRIVHGGRERSDSVLCGLKAVSSRWCMVHDAARPFFSCQDLEKMLLETMQAIVCAQAAGTPPEDTFCGSILACRVADTIKKSSAVGPAAAGTAAVSPAAADNAAGTAAQADADGCDQVCAPAATCCSSSCPAEDVLIADEGKAGAVCCSADAAACRADGAEVQACSPSCACDASARPAVECTVDRSCLWRALTPQLFITSELIEAMESCSQQGTGITDEASAMEKCGRKVLLVEGSPLNFKLTEPADFVMAQALINICLPQEQI